MTDAEMSDVNGKKEATKMDQDKKEEKKEEKKEDKEGGHVSSSDSSDSSSSSDSSDDGTSSESESEAEGEGEDGLAAAAEQEEPVVRKPLVLTSTSGELDLNDPADLATFKEQLARGNSRQQKILIDAAVRHMQTLYKHPSLAEEMMDRGVDIKNFKQVVIRVNRTCKSTKAGGLYRYSALVACGDGNGLVGYGLAKGPMPFEAQEKAYRMACKNLWYFDRFDEHTIWQKQEAHHCKTKVILIPQPTGHGLKANKVVRAVCELVGIKNLTAKVIGSHHPHNTLHAIFKALNNMYTPQELSRKLGRQVEVY
mmetsp:Transcript_9095/g.17088  ORF Transcript_9095/g.17088 Transcript_9095/m.17088 type:complete len:310 (-) Transcript_9095:356-1285(-)